MLSLTDFLDQIKKFILTRDHDLTIEGIMIFIKMRNFRSKEQPAMDIHFKRNRYQNQKCRWSKQIWIISFSYYANNGSEIKSQRNDVIEKLNSELKAKNSLIQSMQMKQYSFNQNVNSEKKTIKFAEERQEISEAEPYEEEAKSQKRFARRKTESSVNISNNMVFTPVKSKIKKKLSNNFSKINTFSTEFKKDKYKFLFGNIFQSTVNNYCI